MTIQHGKMNLTIYRIESNPYADENELIEAVSQKSTMSLEDANNTSDGVSCGLASGKVLLNDKIDMDNSVIDGYVTLNLRSTAKKIDAGMLKALIQCKEVTYMQDNFLEFMPRKARKQIKEDAVERLMPDAKLSIRGTEIVFDEDRLLIGSTSENDCDAVCGYLGKNLGIVSILEKRTNAKGESFGIGREFLTWLFATIQSGAELPGDVKVLIEGPLELIAADSKYHPCTKAKVEGGAVTQSVELNTILGQNKNIRKAKLSLVRGDDVWKFTFDADSWSFGGLELPKDCETFADRIEAIRDLCNEMDGLFNAWKTEMAAALGIQELPNMEK